MCLSFTLSLCLFSRSLFCRNARLFGRLLGSSVLAWIERTHTAKLSTGGIRKVVDETKSEETSMTARDVTPRGSIVSNPRVPEGSCPADFSKTETDVSDQTTQTATERTRDTHTDTVQKPAHNFSLKFPLTFPNHKHHLTKRVQRAKKKKDERVPTEPQNFFPSWFTVAVFSFFFFCETDLRRFAPWNATQTALSAVAARRHGNEETRSTGNVKAGKGKDAPAHVTFSLFVCSPSFSYPVSQRRPRMHGFPLVTSLPSVASRTPLKNRSHTPMS